MVKTLTRILTLYFPKIHHHSTSLKFQMATYQKHATRNSVKYSLHPPSQPHPKAGRTSLIYLTTLIKLLDIGNRMSIKITKKVMYCECYDIYVYR